MKKTSLFLFGTFTLVVVVGGIFCFGESKKASILKNNQNQSNTKNEKPEYDPDSKILENFFSDSEPTSLPEVNISQWKEYRNDIYGVEFKMPNDWEIKNQNDENKTLCLGKKGKQYFYEGEASCGISIGQSVGLSDWIGEKGEENYQRWKQAFNVKKYKLLVGGENAILLKGNGFLKISVPLIDQGMRKEIALYYGTNATDGEETVFYGIAESLHFPQWTEGK